MTVDAARPRSEVDDDVDFVVGDGSDADDYQAQPASSSGISAGGVLTKLVLVFGVGLAIWAATALLVPTTVIDTTNLTDNAPTLAGPGDASDAAADGNPGSDLDSDGGASQAGAPLEVEAGTLALGGGGDPELVGTDPEGDADAAAAGGDGEGETAGAASGLDYQSNLAMLQDASVRNRNHDSSPYLNTPSASLVLQDHYGPRSEYLTQPAGNPENSFPIAAGGQFRAGCEFSHFSYDDPLVFPGKPGASHLHMHFGNTHVNAFSTYDTLINSGSSTCNGQELNRTGYWVPAMFDGAGNVRIPERIVVYYKGEGKARGASEVYPEGAAMIADYNLNTMPVSEGGIGGKKLTFQCSDNFSTVTGIGSQTMASCDGSRFGSAATGRWVVLEMSVKFPQCWNGQDPAVWTNFQPPEGDWYVSRCTGEFSHTLPNLEYFVNYKVDIGENTSDWFLSSDVDPTSFGTAKATGGSTSHGDWWGGWHKDVNQMWIDNCVNFKTSAPSGCGRGYLTDGGPNANAPVPGPALKIRPQYEGPHKVSAETLLAELCGDSARTYSRPEDAAYCAPGTGL